MPNSNGVHGAAYSTLNLRAEPATATCAVRALELGIGDGEVTGDRAADDDGATAMDGATAAGPQATTAMTTIVAAEAHLSVLCTG